MKKTIVVLWLLVSGVAQATILFLDLNNSPEEVKACQRAAQKRGEDCFVIPGPENRAPAVLQRELDALHKEMKKISESQAGKVQMGPTARQVEISKRLRELIPATAKFQYGDEALSRDLQALKDRGSKITSLVLSGHSEGYKTGGSLGFIEYASLQKQLDERGMSSSIRSVYGWGCYTGTPTAFNTWRSWNPNLGLIAGFELKGPSNTRRASYGLLEALLVRDKEIIAESDERRMTALVKGLTDINVTTAAMVSGQTICRARATMCENFDRFKNQDCPGKLMQAQAALLELDKYAQGQLPIPKDTDHGQIRQIYSDIQNLPSDCLDKVYPDEGVEEARQYLKNMSETKESILALIFYKNVLANFKSHYQSDIAAADAALKKLKDKRCNKLAEELPIDRVPNQVPGKIQLCLMEGKSELTDQEIKAIERYHVAVDRVLANRTCTPSLDGWIEDPKDGRILKNPETLPGCNFNDKDANQ